MCEFSRVRVLQRGMVAGNRNQATGQRVLGAVPEEEGGAWRQFAGALCMGQQAAERDASEADDNAKMSKQAQLLIEPMGTVAQLLWRRLVGRGSAANDCADP